MKKPLTSMPLLTAAAKGLEPTSPICTSPEAMAAKISAPELKRRNSMSQPVFFANSPFAMPTKYGTEPVW